MNCILIIAILTAICATTVLVETMDYEYKLAGITEGFIPNSLATFITLVIIFWGAILASPLIIAVALMPKAMEQTKAEVSRSIRNSLSVH